DVLASDDRTVVYRFTRVYPYELMDAVEGNVLPAHAYRDVPLAEWPKRSFTSAPVVDGPFLLKKYERGSLIELARNPRYMRAPLPTSTSSRLGAFRARAGWVADWHSGAWHGRAEWPPWLW